MKEYMRERFHIWLRFRTKRALESARLEFLENVMTCGFSMPIEIVSCSVCLGFLD